MLSLLSLLFLALLSSEGLNLQTNKLAMPIGFTIHRLADPSILFTEYLEKLGVNTDSLMRSYNLISLDGYKFETNYEDKMAPLTIFKNPYQHLFANKGSIYGNSNEEVRSYISKKIHDKNKRILMNVDLRMAPVTHGEQDPKTLAEDVVLKLEELSLDCIDGISIQFEDYNAVYQDSASQWLQTLLVTIRKKIYDSRLIIVLSMPATYVSKLKLFKTRVANALVNYYILQYYGTTETTFTDYESIFTTSLDKFKPASVFQIGTAQNIFLDICRLLIAKPPDRRVLIWNEPQYMNSTSINLMFLRAFEEMGWFGGYANIDFEADRHQQFVNQALKGLKTECENTLSCFC